jgi:hypothetical protein
MDENIVIQRGKKAGNILLVQVIVGVVLYTLRVMADNNFSFVGTDLISGFIIGFFAIGITGILVIPLKENNIKAVRIIYIILCALSVFGLYFSSEDSSFTEGIISIIPSVLVLIAVFNLGNGGKVCCFIASAITFLSVFLTPADPEFGFEGYVLCVLSCVYYIFLGLYIESKGMQIEENPTSEETDPHIYYCNSCGSVYSGYSQIERLCPDCATELIETSITVEEWRKLGDPQKNNLKQAFANGERLAYPVNNNRNIDEQSDRNLSKYDELYKLKELMENGVITPSEYEAKKKQILEL